MTLILTKPTLNLTVTYNKKTPPKPNWRFFYSINTITVVSGNITQLYHTDIICRSASCWNLHPSFQHSYLLDTIANINLSRQTRMTCDPRGAPKILPSRGVSSESRASACILLAVIRDYLQSNHWQSENVQSDDKLDFQIKRTLK